MQLSTAYGKTKNREVWRSIIRASSSASCRKRRKTFYIWYYGSLIPLLVENEDDKQLANYAQNLGTTAPLPPPDALGYANSLKNYRPTRKEVHVVYLGLGSCFP